jgi:hypothetical protein
MFLASLLCCWAGAVQGQTIRVDAVAEHSTNSIVPTRALGAGIDRLPYGAADKLFVEPTIKEVLSAGWQTVSYRQNTELHMEAWHWNPAGTWSDPGGKGYFTGSATPGDLIRHSYGYPLPHRGVTRQGYISEKQSVSYAGIHGRGRFASSAMDFSGSYQPAGYQRDPHRLG